MDRPTRPIHSLNLRKTKCIFRFIEVVGGMDIQDMDMVTQRGTMAGMAITMAPTSSVAP